MMGCLNAGKACHLKMAAVYQPGLISAKMASQDGDGGRRHPKNMEGLFKFCVENTKSENASGLAEIKPMSDEDKKWIQEVMQSLQGNDPIKVMMEDLKILVDPGNPDDTDHVTKQENALEDLELHCEDLDLANDFHKIGGYSVLQALLNSPHTGLRWRAAGLVATLTQNNPYSQTAVLDAGFLPTLLDKLERDESAEVKVKALYAISCLIREHAGSLEAFVKQDGFSHLIRAMVSNIEKLQIKSAFLLSYLCRQHPQYKDALCAVGMVEQLVGILHAPHQQWHEHVTSTLISLVDGHKGAVRECRRPELRLAEILRERKSLVQGRSEYEEEYAYTVQLEKICFSTGAADCER